MDTINQLILKIFYHYKLYNINLWMFHEIYHEFIFFNYFNSKKFCRLIKYDIDIIYMIYYIQNNIFYELHIINCITKNKISLVNCKENREICDLNYIYKTIFL